jgi:3-isopropylmalate/(R)-2-methylmalate dehydratase large subunit
VAAALATGEIWMRVPQTIKFVYHGERPEWVSAKDMILQTIGRIGVEGGRGAVMEFTGEAISGLSMEGRLTMANMAIEAGADAGLFPVDEKTLAYVKERAKWPYEVLNSDPDANYAAVYEFDVSGMEPMVACPYEPSNIKPVSQVDKKPLDQVFIGSCTNNRIEDLRIVADVLRGHTIHRDIRCIIIPGSVDVQRQAMREGLLEVFQDAEAVIAPPGCGPCLGAIWACLALASAPFPPATVISAGAWATATPKSIWQARRLPLPLPCWGGLPARLRLCERGLQRDDRYTCDNNAH